VERVSNLHSLELAGVNMFERKIIIFAILFSVTVFGKVIRSPSIDPDYPTITEAKLPNIEGFNNKKKATEDKNSKSVKTLESSMNTLFKLNSLQNNSASTGSILKPSPSFIQNSGALKKKIVDKEKSAGESVKPVKQSK
jgi:hypothetical protein